MAAGPGGTNLINALRGSIYQATHERLTTSQLWERIRSDLNLPQEGPTGLARGQVNAIWHEAVQARNASEAFARDLSRAEAMGVDRAVTGRMVVVPTWARPQVERNTTPIYQVNFQMTMQAEDGTLDTGWFTIVKRGAIPPTVQGVADMVGFDAEMMAGRYGKSLVDTGSIQIMAI